MEKKLKDFESSGIAVVINGSYARLEASSESDIDFFILAPKGVSKGSAEKIVSGVRKVLLEVVGTPPAEDGVFSSTVELGSLAKQIGGAKDSNSLITRRILFLTEGRAVVGKEVFDNERDAVLRVYVRNTLRDHQLGRFLLNDVIRFYRTMCVDFEHKTVQSGKPWGIRNIKLVFSRKMLYFGGVLICAEIANKNYDAKIEAAKELMAMSPIERVRKVCGAASDDALKEYDYFLSQMADPAVRSHLNGIPEDRTKHSDEFRNLKGRGRAFTLGLVSALRAAYEEDHPIHRALMM